MLMLTIIIQYDDGNCLRHYDNRVIWVERKCHDVERFQCLKQVIINYCHSETLLQCFTSKLYFINPKNDR